MPDEGFRDAFQNEPSFARHRAAQIASQRVIQHGLERAPGFPRQFGWPLGEVIIQRYGSLHGSIMMSMEIE